MPVTLLGMVALVSDEQPSNAQFPMLVTPFLMMTVFTCERVSYHGTLKI